METIIVLIIAIVGLVSLFLIMRTEVSFYEDLYKETDKIAGDFHQIATDAIKLVDEAVNSEEKLIKDLENRDFLIDLFLDGIDDKVADAINEQIEPRGMRIGFNEGEWALFVKRDE
jgi:hypothetical protein